MCITFFQDDHQDEDGLDKIIEQTIEAFDRQNFLTKGFLAKVPEMQYNFLVRNLSYTQTPVHYITCLNSG